MKLLQEQGFPKKFPCGEVHVKIDSIHKNLNEEDIWIEKRIQNSDDIMEIIMLVDAIRRQVLYKGLKLGLRIPYVPYSRQDRVMVPGESLSIKVFADLINSLKLDQVEIWDPHSDVTTVLFDNCRVVSQEALLMAVHTGYLSDNITQTNLAEYILICPDAGARKKIHKVAERCGINQIIYADKVRDVATGKILGTTIDLGDFDFKENSKFLIVDDICDGGRTFIEIAKKLKVDMINILGEYYTIDLHITHGFFTKGLDELMTHFDSISCANLMNQELAKKYPQYTTTQYSFIIQRCNYENKTSNTN